MKHFAERVSERVRIPDQYGGDRDGNTMKAREALQRAIL